MRYLMAVALALLIGAGSAMFFYWHHVSGFLLPLGVVFFRRVIWHVALRFCLLMFAMPLMSSSTRRAYFKLIAEIKRATVVYGEDLIALWKWSPWWLRLPTLLLGAVFAGLAAFVLLVVPVHVSKIPFAGAWLRETCIPWLMRTAAMRGIERNVSPAWRKVPRSIRRHLEKPFTRLWWWTAWHLVETSQMLGPHSIRRRKKEAKI